MQITRIGTTPSRPGPADWFTGPVRLDMLFAAEGDRHTSGAMVTFEPGARTHWHTHPLGQTLVILQGLGWVQREGEPRHEVRPGDVVVFEPGEKHWHGASATVAMVHLAVQEALDGNNVRWLEPVTDGQYTEPG